MLNGIQHTGSEIEHVATEVISKINSSHCYAFIADTTNVHYLNAKLFATIKLRPWFLVTVSDSEDLLSPNYRTVATLRQIHANRCDVYVILIQNGIQVERLLRFADKNRVIDTRAKFVLYHDYRLFTQSMLYIWRRIINVVFIREVRDRRTAAKFELATVPFPYPIQDIFVERQIDVWRRGRFK